MDNDTISGRCRKIRQQLIDLLTVLGDGSAQVPVPTTVTSASVKDVLGKFMLWAGPQGALRKPESESSLDSRLANSPDLQDCIDFELAVMFEALEDHRLDIDYVRRKHPKLGDGVQSSRMGRAIAMRRLFIRYCRDHKHNLAAKDNDGEDTSHLQIGSRRTTTAKQSTKATTVVVKGDLMDTLAGSVDVLGEGQEDDVSHCSDSTTSESLATLKLPRLADLSPKDDPFECPICYTLQQLSSEQAWRHHAYRDLKAYVCTVGGTECDNEFFEDRTSWFNHELEHHRSDYVCLLCGADEERKKTTQSLLRQHILTAHGAFEPDQLERLEEAGRKAMISFKASDCPFCDDWSELIARETTPERTYEAGDDVVVSITWFKKHVAMHLEQLAIFALSCNDHESGMDKDELQSSGWRDKKTENKEEFEALSAMGLGPEEFAWLWNKGS
ncbi:uncharacterized protein B0T23DRAFT_437029 [Neurospora hispaniola]|uniref:Oxidoreductase acuF-like C2H2 type zinc-finger domain-containing protein n=1 Tax=Neurospora hispaniola TaxID=588809 RepID=A0AAJ0HXW9_9PEZI|nr:hypothetical protein B0T23DRAFT_437029 [Neurospora hispaniola]